MRLTEQELAARKDKIIHTAYQMFCECGVDGITLAQVAKQAGVGASAIYRYFETKANLLWHTQLLLWEEIVGQIHADGQEHLLSAKSGHEELSILLYRFKSLYTQYSSYLLFSCDYKMYLLRNHIKLSKQAYNQFMKPVHELFQASLTRGQADGSINSRESVEDQFFTLWGLMRGFTDQIVIYNKIYEGQNPWENRFDILYHYTLKVLEKKTPDMCKQNDSE